VEAQEARWVAEMEAMADQQDKMKREGKEQGGGVGGMLKAVIDTVIGNLQLSIANVHIRYEDALTNPEHPFACGITLDRISGYTVDEAGKEAFVTNNPLQTLRKALLLRRMALYFDTDAEFWRPTADWHDMAPHDWDDWFQPGIRWVPCLAECKEFRGPQGCVRAGAPATAGLGCSELLRRALIWDTADFFSAVPSVRSAAAPRGIASMCCSRWTAERCTRGVGRA
jgi:hypothetical protein